MKKKLLLLSLMMLLITGCAWYGATDEVSEEPYLLYFLESDLQSAAGGGALRPESVQISEEMEGRDTVELAELLMRDLLDGPQDPALKNTIPAGTTLLSLEMDGACAVVDLSLSYGILSGVALTLADQAIVLTLTQLPDILSVKITVYGRELAYRDQQIFTAQDVMLAPEGDVVSTVTASVYFLNEDGALQAEKQTLELYEGDTLVGAVVRAVEDGPQGKKLLPVFPEGFRTKSVWLEEFVCYVNLSSELLGIVKDSMELETGLQALSKSLCLLETVQEVRYLVDGEFAESYGGVHVAEPYTT